jgi:hypothetical protein
MVLLYLPQGVREVGIHFVRAWGHWETAQPKNPPENSELFYFSLFFRASVGLH